VGSNEIAEAAGSAGDSYRVLQLHSDNAPEYRDICHDARSDGVEQSFSPPYTPEHNAIAERVNRTIVEPARSMLIKANLSHSLWP
jgi:transposase InsO family protein